MMLCVLESAFNSPVSRKRYFFLCVSLALCILSYRLQCIGPVISQCIMSSCCDTFFSACTIVFVDSRPVLSSMCWNIWMLIFCVVYCTRRTDSWAHCWYAVILTRLYSTYIQRQDWVEIEWGNNWCMDKCEYKYFLKRSYAKANCSVMCAQSTFLCDLTTQ